jgi:hypothetical protein
MEERAQIDGDHAVEHSEVDRLEGPFAANAGVVDQDFDRPERAFGLGPEALDSGVVRYVALNSQRPAAVSLDRGSDRRRAFWIVVVTEGDIRAFGGEGRRDGCADATTPARDEGLPVLESRRHLQPSIPGTQVSKRLESLAKTK